MKRMAISDSDSGVLRAHFGVNFFGVVIAAAEFPALIVTSGHVHRHARSHPFEL